MNNLYITQIKTSKTDSVLTIIRADNHYQATEMANSYAKNKYGDNAEVKTVHFISHVDCILVQEVWGL